MQQTMDIREIAIVSGKGGTGKTSLAACFAALSSNAVFADCDVDAADLALLLKARRLSSELFAASKKARVDDSKCVLCRRCAEVCRYLAIEIREGSLNIDDFSCEGCRACYYSCPVAAITMESVVSGEWYLSDSPYGPLVHGRLSPGEENSGKLVTLVRNRARDLAQEQGRDLVIIDGPPGIGCPVIASISGVRLALVVTEPSLSGLHDMERVLDVIRHFGAVPAVCINRYDLHLDTSEIIERRCDSLGIPVLGRIPYDRAVVDALVQGIPVVEYSGAGVTGTIREIWERMCQMLRGGRGSDQSNHAGALTR